LKGSIKIASLFGIPVLLHWSFALIILYVFYIGNSQQLESHQIIWLGILVIALFASILMHEFGHALTARRFGVMTKDIILLPIGGIARLAKLPDNPLQEFQVAIAGPLVNIVLAVLLSGYYLIFDFPDLSSQVAVSETDLIGNYTFFIPSLIFLNIVLAFFNLLPAFPMDGGRILRSLLATKLGRLKATRISVFLGQAIAILMVFYSVMEYSFSTGLIGIFIYFTASQEYRWVRRESILSNYQVGQVFRTHFTPLYLSEKIQKAYDLMLRNGEKNFLVYNYENQPFGTLAETSIINALRQNALDQPVSSHFDQHVEVISPEENLKTAIQNLNYGQASILAVIFNGQVIGVLDNAIIETLMNLKR
jgi:Zn-dependent protease